VRRVRIAYGGCVLRIGQREAGAYCVWQVRIAYGQCEAGAYCVWQVRIAYGRCVLRIAYRVLRITPRAQTLSSARP
jgi:hypothetical protein